VELDAGSIVPADLRLIEARDCVVDQSLLTGEAAPVEKRPGDCDPAAGPARRFNSLFMGTSLRSGWACAVVVDTGAQAVYGSIAGQLEAPPPATEFERGLHDFGALLIRVMLAVVATVLAVNVVLQRPAVEMLLFAAALAVGLSPELLPAILTVTLSHGARAMAKCGVIVKRLDAIENLGSVDLLCTDKTGTLTRGVEQLDGAVDAGGEPSSSVLRLAAANARLQTGLRNSLDDAIFRYADTAGVNWAPPRIAELPYDFHRRRLSVLVDDGASSADASTGRLLITKGAVREMLAICTRITNGAADAPLDAPTREVIERRFIEWSGEGYRVLAVATRRVDRPEIGRDDERDMRLEGFLLFLDPPEPQVRATLATLAARNVAVRMITGDNRHVAQHVARAIGMDARQVMVGPELQGMSVAQLAERVRGTAVFAEIDPDQKERIIHALRRAGHVVGYLGDGINDAAALHAADVGISVDTAVDVAQQAADFVLLRHDLDVLRAGIDEGRRTFANTLK
jgi:Mg2+-importing ATPase